MVNPTLPLLGRGLLLLLFTSGLGMELLEKPCVKQNAFSHGLSRLLNKRSEAKEIGSCPLPVAGKD